VALILDHLTFVVYSVFLMVLILDHLTFVNSLFPRGADP
jgi:hypothetical protein